METGLWLNWHWPGNRTNDRIDIDLVVELATGLVLDLWLDDIGLISGLATGLALN